MRVAYTCVKYSAVQYSVNALCNELRFVFYEITNNEVCTYISGLNHLAPTILD